MATSAGLAYSRCSAEYRTLLGSMDSVHPSDRALVENWANCVGGDVIDAGCGPGHWTNFLRGLGVSAVGVDQVPEFIDNARDAYPGSVFRLESFESLGAKAGSVSGVLSWYSLIHHEPDTIRIPLSEFHRVLRPGGELLVGFFEGPALEKFEHAVIPAYRWPVSAFGDELTVAGFEIVETHTRTTSKDRPHAAIQARRQESS